MEEEKSYKGKGAFDAFLNLLSLITLGWGSVSIGATLFQLVNKFFVPVAVDYFQAISQGILKFNIASAIIITPIFLAMIGWLHHNYKTGNLNHQSGIHRWLTYLMLLISALTVIGRLVYQLFRFLDGDYTVAVILRTLVILVIAGGIFSYYFYDLLRKDFTRRSAVSVVFLAAVIVLALFAVVSGFFVIDSPAKARVIKFDNQRVTDLVGLSYMISDYYRQNGQLPADLSLLQFTDYRDPESREAYAYTKKSDSQYELCATFSLAAADSVEKASGFRPMNDADIYAHGAGRQCFVRSAQVADIIR